MLPTCVLGLRWSRHVAEDRGTQRPALYGCLLGGREPLERWQRVFCVKRGEGERSF